MRRPVALAAALLALLLGAAPARAAAGTSPAEVGAAVAREVVHVAPGAEGVLSPAAALDVRARIAEKDPGRIRIAAVPAAAARAAGSLRKYANLADQAEDLQGTLLVIDGDEVWLVTSWEDVDAATQAVQRADAPHRGGHRGFLLRAVDELAAVDPGEPKAPPAAAVPVAPRDPEAIDADDSSGDATGTLKLVLLIVGIAIALPFVTGAVLLVRSSVRRRRQDREGLALAWEEAQRRLSALADAITELDSSTPAPGSPTARLLDAYEHAEMLLDGEPTTRALTPATAALDDAEWTLARTAAPPSPASA